MKTLTAILAIAATLPSIGWTDFDSRVRWLYKSLVEDNRNPQDVAFREQMDALTPGV